MDQLFLSSYSLLWKKYRPVILKMMLDAQTAPQTYQLFAHELKASAPKGKSSGFTLLVNNSKALNKISTSPIAQDLLSMISQSKKATELMQNTTYEFTLGRDNKLRISIPESETPAPVVD